MFLNDKELKKAIVRDLKNYHPRRHQDPLQDSSLSKLIAIRELVRLESGMPSEPLAIGKAVRQLLEQAIGRLKEQNENYAEVLRLRFFRGREIKDIGVLLGKAPATIWGYRRRGIDGSVDIIKIMEDEAIKRERLRIATLKAPLPTPTYEQLFGFDHYLLQVEEGLNADGEEPGLPIVMMGLGGIGKTSLALEGISDWLDKTLPLIEHLLFVRVDTPYVEKDHVTIVMDQIILSLGQQLEIPLNQLPNQEIQIRRLAEYLADHPALIVIDNIETPYEVQATTNLVRRIGSLAQIVITSRHEFDDLALRPIILKELAQPDAFALLQGEAKRLRMTALTEHTTNEIFTQVGGHPLALKLVIAQLRRLPLSRVLDGLERNSPISDKLYDHIYETSWRLLNQISRNILLGLILLPPSGATWEWLELAVEGAEIEVNEHHIEQAIQELSTLNLLQISASQPPLYSLHQLTYCFLGWKSGLLKRED